MRFKVGDLVEYRGVTVRVMRAKDGDITLAKFGSFREDNPEIKLVLSATLPELKQVTLYVYAVSQRVKSTPMDVFGPTTWTTLLVKS